MGGVQAVVAYGNPTCLSVQLRGNWLTQVRLEMSVKMVCRGRVTYMFICIHSFILQITACFPVYTLTVSLYIGARVFDVEAVGITLYR